MPRLMPAKPTRYSFFLQASLGVRDALYLPFFERKHFVSNENPSITKNNFVSKLISSFLLGFIFLFSIQTNAQSPIIQNTRSYIDGTERSSHTISLPTGIQAGDLILVSFRIRSGRAVSSFTSGWTELLNADNNGRTYVYYRTAQSSSESFIISLSGGSSRIAAVSYRISNWNSGDTPQVAVTADGEDPPSLNPGWGAFPSLYLAGLSFRESGNEITGIPSDFTDLVIAQNTPGSSNLDRFFVVGLVQKFSSAASEDPSTFSTGGADPTSFTIAIRGPVNTVSGRVTGSISSGVSVRAIDSANGNELATTTTNGSGDYTLTVPSGASFRVEPSVFGHSFDPVSRTFSSISTNQTGQNFTSTALTLVTQTITDTGSGSFTVPTGVTSLRVEAWGGGGRGSTRSSNGVGGGGGGGAYSASVLSVTSGSISYSVGAGSTTTSAGGDTWFDDTNTLLAKGGNSVADNTTNGVTGGQSSQGRGQVLFSGGTGANGASSRGGGG